MTQNPITVEHVKEALKADKGRDAVLKSWKVVDFTKPGDNYMCAVTRAEVRYTLYTKDELQVSYVVKVNPKAYIAKDLDLENICCYKEGNFYKEIVPALNEVLSWAGQEPLHLPKCFHISLEEGKQQFYFEDLRAKDFKMFDRKKDMNKDHVDLIMRELARLHSASHLLMSKFLEGETAATKYEFLSRDWLTFSPDAKNLVMSMFDRQVDTGIKILEKIGGYETAIEWLESFKSEIENVLSAQMQSKKFNSICHGDCWNNNIMFRYDDYGHPIDVMLVDLQLCREASLATDLNFFFYTSVAGEERRQNIDYFMSVYYLAYKKVLEGANLPVQFSEQELFQEFRDKNRFGLIFGLTLLPIILTGLEEDGQLKDKDRKAQMRELRERAMNSLDSNSLFKTRFLSMFDEFMETEMIS